MPFEKSTVRGMYIHYLRSQGESVAGSSPESPALPATPRCTAPRTPQPPALSEFWGTESRGSKAAHMAPGLFSSLETPLFPSLHTVVMYCPTRLTYISNDRK